MARRGAAVGPYKFTAKQVEPIKAERRKKMRKLQSHPPTKREEAKRQNASGRPLSPGARAYADRQAKEGKPITHKGGGKKLSPQRRQQIRERELADMYLSRRRLAKQPASPKPLPKGVSGPVLPKAKPGKPTVSDRPALHRIKALARQDTRDEAKARKTTFLGTVPVAGVVTNQMRKELEGSGALGAVFGGLSKAMREQTAAITGPDTPGGIPGTKGVAKVIGNAAADLFEMPAQAAPSIYMPAKAVAKDIAHGKHGKGSESRKFVDDYLKTSATALAVQGKGKEAKKAAGEHPLFTLMELRGIKAGVGRGAGAGMRAIPGKPRQLASTKRAPLKVHGNITVPRRYSKDVLTKGATVMGEKVKRKRGIDPDQASPRQIVRELKRRTDEEVAAVEGTRRANRDRIIKEWEGKNEPHPAAPLAAQGMARRPDTLYKDLAAYRNHLKRVDKSEFSKAEKAANRQLVHQIERALKKQIDPQEVFAQAEKFKKQQAPLMGELVRKSDLEPAQVRMAPLIPYARSHMGAKWNKATRSLEIDGKRVTAGQIEAHMKANGVKRPAFISQKPNFRGAQNYYLNSQTPKHKVAGKSRTGEATYKGTFDADPKVMSEQLVRQRGLIDAIDGFDTTIKTFGTRPAKNKYFKSFDEAKRFAEENRRDHDGNLLADNVELVPVRIAPFAANKATLGKIKDGLESDAGVDALHDMGAAIEKANGMVDAALQPGPGPVVLMPKVVMNRLRQHNEVASGTTGKAVGAVSSTFKKTVLPVSPKWLTGNIVDPSVRLAMEGATPIDAVNAFRVAKRARKLDAKAGQSLDVRALGGLHLSSVKKNAKHREASQFKDTALETPANVIGTARRTPIIKQIINTYDAYAGAVFKLNSKFERGFQYAAMGKELRRQVADTTGEWHKSIRLGNKAIEDLAKGLLNTDNQVAMGRSIDRVLGKWDKNGPVARRALIDYAPFGQWYRAATTYVLVTFPKDHPVKLGVLASLENMTEVERKKLGLTKRGGGVPGFLQGSIPTDKGLIPFGGYSSFGYFGDLPSNSASMILPWLPLNELRGISWQGNKIRNKDGSELSEQQRISLAAYSLIESVVPLTAMGRRLQEGGGSSTDFSTILSPKVKPGTKGDFKDAANRVFNPFRVAGSPKGKQKAAGYDWSQVNLDPKSTGSFDWSKVVIK